MIGLDMAVNGFYSGESDRGMSVDIFWGTESIDKSEVNQWDAEDLGVLNWDNQFDLSPKANQRRLIEFCSQLRVSHISNLIFFYRNKNS